MTVEFFKDEIIKAYSIFGAEKAFNQTCFDVNDWKKQGFVNDKEQDELIAFNKKYFEEYTNGNK